MSEKYIGLLCDRFYPEMVSTGLHMTELSCGLAENGWRIRAYCPQPAGSYEGPRPDREEYRGVEIRRVQRRCGRPGGLAGRTISAAKYVLASIRCLRADRKDLAGVIATTNPPFIGAAAFLMRTLFGVPYAMLMYDVYPDTAIRLGVLRRKSWPAKVWELISRATLRHAAVIIAIGHDMEAVIREKAGPRAHVIVIPNWADGSRLRPIPAAQNTFRRDHGLDGKLIVQYAGNIGRTHDVEVIVDAARKLRRESRVIFQFVGDGAKKEKLRCLVREASLSNVQFVPYQPFATLAATLSAADLSLVTLGEKFTGLSVPSRSYAIMAAGVPILALVDPVGEIGRMVTSERCGEIVWPPDGARLAAAVMRLLADPDRLRAMGANGRRALLDRYDLRLALQRYDAVLKSAFGNSARHAAEARPAKAS